MPKLSYYRKFLALPYACALILQAGGLLSPGAIINPAMALPVVPMTATPPRVLSRPVIRQNRQSTPRPHHARSAHTRVRNSRKKMRTTPRMPAKAPQELIGRMAERTIAPGVVHKVYRGSPYINLLDVDTKHANLHVKPIMAGESFDRLDEVKDQAQRVRALAAINANYFKKDGTPLGTLLVDGEWVAGPLFERSSLGITQDGRILVDNVSLHGTLETSNPDVGTIWVNNVNQPRRTGARLIVYTRRWGQQVAMHYAGALIAVDATGRVIDKKTTIMPIPYGGYVLSDSKTGAIANLERGDLVHLNWHPTPSSWSSVVSAVSGGPVLIRNGNLFVNVAGEHFRKNWSGAGITARTAIGVTRDRHLLLVTIEGRHTLYDVAKFLRKLGAVDAMNLDGGGSTTMVVNGVTVTRNPSHFERRVASCLAVMPGRPAVVSQHPPATPLPTENITDFAQGSNLSVETPTEAQFEVSSGRLDNAPVQPESELQSQAQVAPPAAIAEPIDVTYTPEPKHKKKSRGGFFSKFVP